MNRIVRLIVLAVFAAAGEVQFMFDAIAGHQPFIKLGRVKALAVTDTTRVPLLPKVPTMTEAGYKDVHLVSWAAAFPSCFRSMPARTPTNSESRRPRRRACWRSRSANPISRWTA